MNTTELYQMARDDYEQLGEELKRFDPYLYWKYGTAGALKAVIDELKWYRENKWRIKEWKDKK